MIDPDSQIRTLEGVIASQEETRIARLAEAGFAAEVRNAYEVTTEATLAAGVLNIDQLAYDIYQTKTDDEMRSVNVAKALLSFVFEKYKRDLFAPYLQEPPVKRISRQPYTKVFEGPSWGDAKRLYKKNMQGWEFMIPYKKTIGVDDTFETKLLFQTIQGKAAGWPNFIEGDFTDLDIYQHTTGIKTGVKDATLLHHIRANADGTLRTLVTIEEGKELDEAQMVARESVSEALHLVTIGTTYLENNLANLQR